MAAARSLATGPWTRWKLCSSAAQVRRLAAHNREFLNNVLHAPDFCELAFAVHCTGHQTSQKLNVSCRSGKAPPQQRPCGCGRRRQRARRNCSIRGTRADRGRHLQGLCFVFDFIYSGSHFKSCDSFLHFVFCGPCTR